MGSDVPRFILCTAPSSSSRPSRGRPSTRARARVRARIHALVAIISTAATTTANESLETENDNPAKHVRDCVRERQGREMPGLQERGASTFISQGACPLPWPWRGAKSDYGSWRAPGESRVCAGGYGWTGGGGGVYGDFSGPGTAAMGMFCGRGFRFWGFIRPWWVSDLDDMTCRDVVNFHLDQMGKVGEWRCCWES